LQAKKVLIRLTPKEKDHVVHKAKWFKWEGNSLLWMWANGQVEVVPCPRQHERLVRHAHKELGHFGVWWTYNLLRHNTTGEGCNCNFNNLFIGV
jgi:hypothetical protein